MAADDTRAVHGYTMDTYNRRKEDALREIYDRALRGLGLTV